MLEENKNLKSQIKDPERKSLTSYGTDTSNMSIRLSYTKTNKLISALYMVTDIMDIQEPLRGKLRNLGANIISDIYSSINKGQAFYNQINNRISETLSFIEVGSSVGIISEMNSSILIKEFIELRKSILEVAPKNPTENWLEEFMKAPTPEGVEVPNHYKNDGVGKNKIFISMGHTPVNKNGMRIGVQKGGTLMKALSDKIPHIIKTKHVDVLKNKRREEIILVIKDKMKNSGNPEGVTITDIKSNGHEALASCGEKTLQRELVSMVSAGILKKTGEKRWSRYSIN